MTLLDEVHLFLERTGIGRAEFGRAITGNTGMLRAWETGKRHVGARVVDRIRGYMLDNCERRATERPQKVAAPTAEIIDLSADPDNWPAQAREASRELVARLRRHHPDQCAQARNHSQHF